jgi:hypothetical protein
LEQGEIGLPERVPKVFSRIRGETRLFLFCVMLGAFGGSLFESAFNNYLNDTFALTGFQRTVWKNFGYTYVFLIGACIVAVNFFSALQIRIPAKKARAVADG